MALGDFSPTIANSIRLKAEQMWSDGIQAADYKSYAPSAVAVIQNSSARFTVFRDRVTKRRVVEVTWIDACATVDAACTPNCDFDGTEAESVKQVYEPQICREVKFKVDETEMENNDYTYEEVVAKKMAKAIKSLDEYVNAQVLLKIKANMQWNADYAPYTKFATSNAAVVPIVDFNRKMVAEIMKDTVINNINSPYYISNGDLYTDWMNARIDSGNDNGSGDNRRTQLIDPVFDLKGFTKAGIVEDVFAIASSALAFVSLNRNPDTAIFRQMSPVSQWRYTIPSQVLPNVKYDVYRIIKCVDEGNDDHLVHIYKVVARFDVFVNPKGCPVEVSTGPSVFEGPTGILGYQKAAA